MMLEWNVRIAGVLLLLLLPLNFCASRRFRWSEDLAGSSLLTRQVFAVHYFFIALVVAMMGTLALVFTPALLSPTPLSRLVLAALTIFWAARFFIQLFIYDPALWRGNRLFTTLHIVFATLWAYLAGTFGFAFWAQCLSH